MNVRKRKLLLSGNSGSSAFDKTNVKLATPGLWPDIEPWTYQITFVDQAGKVIFEAAFGSEDLFSGKKVEPAVHMHSGSYIVRIRQGNQVIHRRMIIR